MHCRYGFRAIRSLPSISSSTTSCWNPLVSLQLNHPSLVLLEKCTTRNHFKQIVAQIMRSSFIGDTFSMSRLLLFSAATHPENLDLAMILFHHFTPNPNLYIYNTMISAVSYSARKSFCIYRSMLRSHVEPDRHTLLYLFKSSECLCEVKQVHCHGILTGLLLQCNYLANSLVKVFVQHDCLDLAHKVFVQMPEPDVASFNIMISGYAKKGFVLEAMAFYYQMLSGGFKPDEYTVVGLLLCCGQMENLRLSKAIHAWMHRRKSVGSCNLILCNALIDVYLKCKESELAMRVFDALMMKDVVSWNTMIAGFVKESAMEAAQEIFRRMPERDIFSWNSLISGYAQQGDYAAVRDLFIEMGLEKNVVPDSITMVNLVSAMAEMGDMDQGRQIHSLIFRMKMKVDAFLGSALVDMYCKCGSVEQAFLVFKAVTAKDVTLCTAMITGFAFNGYGIRALELFHEMRKEIIPNKVTLVAILTACSHSGLVDAGIQIFYGIKENYGFEPELEHFGCLVDLLCRSGRLKEAKDVIATMPMKPSQSIWGSVLSACRAHGDMEMAERASSELMELEPEKEGGYILLSNMYAASGHWSFSDKIRRTMDGRGVKKTAGCSGVVVNGAVHSFAAADGRHPRWSEILSVLINIHYDMKSKVELSSDLYSTVGEYELLLR